MIYNALLIPVMSWLDRQRGMPKDQEMIPKLPAFIGMGLVTSYLCGYLIDWQTVAITLGVAVLHNISFGEPLGHALTGIGGATADDGTTYEVWQKGILKENPWAALAFRGAIVGGAGLLALDPVSAIKIAIAFGISFPLAAFISRKLFNGDWAKNEYIRGALIGTILFMETYI